MPAGCDKQLCKYDVFERLPCVPADDVDSQKQNGHDDSQSGKRADDQQSLRGDKELIQNNGGGILRRLPSYK